MDEEKQLRSSEWLLALSICIIIASLFALAKWQTWHYAKPVNTRPTSSRIEVQISGAVAKPGTYACPQGSTLGEALRKAKPLRSADLRSLDLAERIIRPTQLQIGTLTELTVHLKGALETTLQVPVGSRICDLKKMLSLPSDADRAFFKRRRLLADGETIEVPRRQKSS